MDYDLFAKHWQVLGLAIKKIFLLELSAHTESVVNKILFANG